MTTPNIPPVAVNKLLALDTHLAALKARATTVDEAIEVHRKRLDGRIRDPRDDPQQLKTALMALLEEEKTLASRIRAEEAVLSRTRNWLNTLPSDTVLTVAPIDSDIITTADLNIVRARLQQLRTEIAALESAPTPPEDIRTHVRAHIGTLAKPTVSGINNPAANLKIVWPGARDYNDERGCDLLAMLSLLFPEQLTDTVMREIDRMAATPAPIEERPAALATRHIELAELGLIEEQLIIAAINSGDRTIHRSHSADPAAVLGLRVTHNEQEEDTRSAA